ncbi:uncharacterized protein EDB91DRAFT_1230500 [Suillus paluster]|uniref:uncharacterized protein n=1 Tax=Suillus paluster TaxID=48578 RepID=UPI001B8701ED|nr:uncharacterized protein EDB91DRAFT_1230500 [Suillus paluster]KAG1722788.1 hypothetical protein EDB91DRAFT_1230500 [Suillus paluster]
MSLAKLPLIFVAAVGFHISVTAPDAAERDRVVIPSAIERLLTPFSVLVPRFLKGTIWLVTAAETAVILTRYIPPHHISPGIADVLGKLGTPDASKLTTISVLGSLMVVMSSYIRWKCYRTLGRFFTYELSIRDDHKLITSGPYSVVRHPSYTGLAISFAGACLTYGAPGSWLRESGILGLPFVSGVAKIWTALMVIVVACLAVRIPHEDKLMAQSIGKEWEEWAQRVKYRLIPGIY